MYIYMYTYKKVSALPYGLFLLPCSRKLREMGQCVDAVNAQDPFTKEPNINRDHLHKRA